MPNHLKPAFSIYYPKPKEEEIVFASKGPGEKYYAYVQDHVHVHFFIFDDIDLAAAEFQAWRDEAGPMEGYCAVPKMARMPDGQIAFGFYLAPRLGIRAGHNDGAQGPLPSLAYVFTTVFNKSKEEDEILESWERISNETLREAAMKLAEDIDKEVLS